LIGPEGGSRIGPKVKPADHAEEVLAAFEGR